MGVDVEPSELPRALSEEHMIQERGIRRGWFILAGNAASDLPRFDIRARYAAASAVFDEGDSSREFAKTGGVLILTYATRDKLPVLDPVRYLPVAQWTDEAGSGTYIYCTPEAILSQP